MPSWGEEIGRRLAGLRLAPAREAEVVEELSQHLDDRYRELCLGGADHESAVRESLAELDDTDLVREMAGVEGEAVEPLPIGGPAATLASSPLAGLWHDVRFGARLLMKDKGMTFVVVVTLAIAIAANTIVFSLTDLLWFKPVPVANAQRLAAVFAADERSATSRDPLSIPQYRDVVQQNTSFESVGAMFPRQLSLTGSGEPQVVIALLATANLFSTLGLDPVVGRTFLPGEDEPGRSNVAVLSHRFWTSRFHADPDVVGRTLVLNGTPHAVVGVLTPSIEVGSLGQVDLWIPADTSSSTTRQRDRELVVYGLLRDSQTVASANADLAAITERLRRTYPVTDGRLQMHALSMRDANVSPDTPLVLTMAAIVVGVVLLLACANVGTVMQARASTRQREIALRLALGATRARLVRQLISEGAFLGAISGVVGVALAAAAVPGLRLLTSDRYTQTLDISGNTLIFAAVLSMLTPILFGVVPALQSSRPNLNEDLKEAARIGPSKRLHHRRSALVITQVALALTALIISGLVVRTVFARQQVPLGIASNDVLCARVRFDPPKYMDDASRVRAVDDVLARVSALPGIDAVAATTRVPVFDPEPQRQFTILGRSNAAGDIPWAVEATMTSRFREVMKLPVLDGRTFTNEDRSGSARVAVVSREAVKRYWPGQSPIGQRIALLNGAGDPTDEPTAIVGVVDDVKGVSLTEPAPPRIYFPLAQRVGESVVFTVRTARDTSLMATLIRGAMRAEDPDLALSEIRPLDAMLDTRLFRPFHLVVALFASFAAIGLVLALTGVYGVAAFAVGQRRHEIAIRLALGATSAEVTRLVVARSFRPIGIGLLLGALGGWGVASLMRGVLFGTTVLDPSTYITVIGLLALGGFGASFVPAHRAAASDPAFVLKQE